MTTKLNGQNVLHIDAETGEVICETEQCTEIKDNKLSESELKQKEYIDSHFINFNKGEKFVKLFTETIHILTKKLSNKELQLIMGLAKYVSYEDCALRYGTGANSHFMDINEMAQITNTDYTRTTRLISSLIKKGVIGELKVGHREGKITQKIYLVNPYIFINGKNPEKEVYSYFQKSGWKEFIENELTIKDK